MAAAAGIPRSCRPRGRRSSAFQWEADKVIIRKGLRGARIKQREARVRERNNRFQLDSPLSPILFELAANFACLHRPAPLSQKNPALSTSNPALNLPSPLALAASAARLRSEQGSPQLRERADTPLSSTNHLSNSPLRQSSSHPKIKKKEKINKSNKQKVSTVVNMCKCLHLRREFASLHPLSCLL